MSRSGATSVYSLQHLHNCKADGAFSRGGKGQGSATGVGTGFIARVNVVLERTRDLSVHDRQFIYTPYSTHMSRISLTFNGESK